MSDEAEIKTYRIRRSCGKWYLKIYEGYTLTKPVEEIGPFEYHEAIAFAKDFDMADGDKGPEQSHVRGFHNVR